MENLFVGALWLNGFMGSMGFPKNAGVFLFIILSRAFPKKSPKNKPAPRLRCIFAA
ncbi:MAG: hypothetical protein R2792_02545 [Saprospiraceae bacterium]